jgi:hypothetical protein
MPAQMTATAYRQGLRNALVCAVAVSLVLCALAGLVWSMSDMSVWEAFAVALAVLCGGVLLWFFAVWLMSRQRGGAVLLDCGPHPTRKMFLLNALLWFFLGPILGVSISSMSVGLAVAALVLGVSFGLFYLALATGRLQFRQGGIWQYWGLLPWRKLANYRWAEDSTLLFQVQGAWPFLRRGALPVPPEHKDAVEQLLQTYSAAGSGRPSEGAD